MKICVAGGSSPFTAKFIDTLTSLARTNVGGNLTLHGRNQQALRAISAYARHQLAAYEWKVETSVKLCDAVSDADYVIHQIRYGGLELRAAGEQLCQRLGCVADETLGPAALLTAAYLVNPLRETCDILRQYAPHAWVLNLTNPLSVSTALMKRFGVDRLLGICELPQFTANVIAQEMDLQPLEMHWDYIGLNHRGFLFELRSGKVDLLGRLAERLPIQTLPYLDLDTLRSLNGVPTKYVMSCCMHPNRGPSFGRNLMSRSAALMDIRQQILDQLIGSPTATPPALELRYMQWYDQGVLPLLHALQNATSTQHVVNVVRPGASIAVECRSMVSNRGVTAMDAGPASAAIRHWVERFMIHESTLLENIELPLSKQRLLSVLSLDPSVQECTRQMVTELFQAIRWCHAHATHEIR